MITLAYIILSILGVTPFSWLALIGLLLLDTVVQGINGACSK
jgi:hypothetical protein